MIDTIAIATAMNEAVAAALDLLRISRPAMMPRIPSMIGNVSNANAHGSQEYPPSVSDSYAHPNHVKAIGNGLYAMDPSPTTIPSAPTAVRN